MRIDQPDGDEGRADAGDAADRPGADGARDEPDVPGGTNVPGGSDANADRRARIDRVLEHRVTVDAAYRVHAIDQAYERVRDIERDTVTPAMKRIEAEDPERHLAGLENSLKGKDRLTEKVNEAMTERARTVEQAIATIKDAIRYTFCYDDDHYTDGVLADCGRLEHAGFGFVERRNSWDGEEYKGINSRWRVPGNEQVFEVQFHTQTSLDAKEETHWAYEKLRDPATSKAEQETLSAYQRAVNAHIAVPAGALGITGYP